MESVDKRFVLVAENGDRLYPYKKEQRLTNRYGFALTAPGEQDRKGGGTYTEDISIVVKRLIFDHWSVRVKTIDKVGRQRDGTLGIGKKVIVGYELAEELEHLVKGAEVKPLAVLNKKNEIISIEQPEKEKKQDDETLIDEVTLRAIKSRRGQPEFRKSLLQAYGNKCCITGCSVISVLEAAHIIPHSEETNYKVTNGVLLRADIHTLFDLNLIGIDPGGIVHVSEGLVLSEYEKYRGVHIAESISQETINNLKERYESFFVPINS